MQNKLQELTDKLYKEGLAKGKQDADTLLEEARALASKIVEEAKEQAAKIISNAENTADDIRTRTEGDIKMASTQTLTVLRQQIEQMVSAKAIGAKVDDALADRQFIGKVISTVAAAFKNDGSAASLDVILPSEMKQSLEDFVAKNIDKELSKSMTFGFSDDFAEGFRIAPKDKGYYIDFSDDTFKSLLGEYLRPATSKILFG